MIITTIKPYSLEEIKKLKEEFGLYIKTVIDIKKKICSAGMKLHFEGEQILISQESDQINIWGGGVDLQTKTIDFNAIINIRPRDNNRTNVIQDPKIQVEYEKLTKHFFKEIL
ncbi:hypothetical protein KKD62_00820 [Patescibacteria group bacterium]|nr:hypothetical protein [Patescibacteria group bacterium]MBU1931477.1 hypothetical protein [Patescibacteria group bacterium]